VHYEHGEVGGKRLDGKLAHHERDLTTMVSGMVRQMLHEVCQTDLLCANRKLSVQGFCCYAIHEVDLISFDFRPLSLHRGDVRKVIRIVCAVVPVPKIQDECRAGGQFLPTP
jgi:hypothetical protein